MADPQEDLTCSTCQALYTMARPQKPQLRRWQAMLIRNRGEVLGTAEAPDEQAAKQAAAERYGLTAQQLARLALREMR